MKAAGSAAFKVAVRTDPIDSLPFDTPGPGDYLTEVTMRSLAAEATKKKNSNLKEPKFGIKSIRFGKDDTLAPGPGTYKLPSSVTVKNP